MTTERPYGTWESPISADLIAGHRIRLVDLCIDGKDLYWSESRPVEKGRYAIVKRSENGDHETMIPAPYNARDRIHEYGGAAFAVFDGVIYFTNYADQRVYRTTAGNTPEPLTTIDDVRHGDFALDRQRSRLIAVREDTLDGGSEPKNSIAAIALSGDGAGESRILIEGADFYSNPRVSPDGDRLLWLEWHHPNMPWDETELWTGRFDDAGEIVDRTRIAGTEKESIFQPEWSPEGDVYFVSDRTGWWNLYRRAGSEDTNLTPEDVEYGAPGWNLGASTYAVDTDGTLLVRTASNGVDALILLDPKTGERTPITLPSTEIARVVACNGMALAIVASPREANTVVSLDLATRQVAILRHSIDIDIDRDYLSVPGAITYPTSDNQVAHGFFYPPQNRDFTAPAGELPPLIVESHGGPTGSTSTGLEINIQFWTSRGFAVLDVNYRGSTGYGRAYRDALDGTWGVYDVDDCVYGARYLADEGLVDPDRLLIHGWSASGYTTLAALTFRDDFRAGASNYGISDLEAMVLDTHKFESRYLDDLVAPYPEQKSVYDERSPIQHIDMLSSPLILLQGLEDKVVPPNQAEMMFEAVDRKGIPVAMLLFEGEQHGFRQSQNIKRALEAELYFYGKVLGFEPAGEIEAVEIRNLG
ncbi:MAG: S9 family peptidase [Thermomicrobiales bacterium]|nr:S9 family peptidase [Thermomicrobiales bacterium]